MHLGVILKFHFKKIRPGRRLPRSFKLLVRSQRRLCYRSNESILLNVCFFVDEECRKRWRTLRERYTRELRRFKTHKADPNASTGTEALGAAAWNLYNEMSFLQDHVKLRKTRSSFERTTLQIHNKDDAEENMMDNGEEVYAKFKISKIEDANNDQIVIEHYREDPLSRKHVMLHIA